MNNSIPENILVLASHENDTLAGWHSFPLNILQVLFHCLPSENAPEESEISLNCLVLLFLWLEVYGGGERIGVIVTCSVCGHCRIFFFLYLTSPECILKCKLLFIKFSRATINPFNLKIQIFFNFRNVFLYCIFESLNFFSLFLSMNSSLLCLGSPLAILHIYNFISNLLQLRPFP